jgi:hypothetical protein
MAASRQGAKKEVKKPKWYYFGKALEKDGHAGYRRRM